jgi:hypothetical protein
LFTLENAPPRKTSSPEAATAYTGPLTDGRNDVSAPVAVLNAAERYRVMPLTDVNEPTAYSTLPSGDSARPFTSPLVVGDHEVSS